MQITTLMSKKVVSVSMDDKLSKVKEIFESKQFHHLLVTESHKLVGIISDRDLFKSISPHLDTVRETTRDLSCLNKRAHQIMSRHPVCLEDNASLKDAIQIFSTHKISCIPVVTQEMKIVGIVSWRDIIKVLCKAYHIDC